ncbi:thiol reductase thioredoxin [Thermoanaerobacterium sp. PSU-2]|uniref:thioredoxin family protein n=1 Tax=Thermoanaerobacterium sp. PSU-2 TaxID=1930849 RepID=UPI000A1608F0|nr:thioredoxin family protein [Thermoanaerobacterium sp. PSU-2]ORX24659.1 thiol reductase thioredoxin [Thermoanaerobacterium sp. PSU-2]HHV75450.1 thioredoxin family protein [Thermoanaerobacterium sp.]
MEKLYAVDDIKKFVNDEEMALLYFSTNDCGICTTLLPKLEMMLLNYDQISSGHVSIDELPAASSEFSVFTVPTVLLFVEGKEVIREARFISMDILEEKIQKYYDLFFS